MLLELKLLADVGLVGFPNVGNPPSCPWPPRPGPRLPTTTLPLSSPTWGWSLWTKGSPSSWPISPGIIEGAAEGAGLGHDFLRHIDRCRLLIHIVDVSGSEGRDPVEDFEAINAELKEYSPALASRKMIVAANKTDILEDRSLLEKLKAHVEAQGLQFLSCPPPPILGYGSS